MRLKPKADVGNIHSIWEYALTVEGYIYAQEHLHIECGDLANERLRKYEGSGMWEGSFEELRCCLFFEQRRWHSALEDPRGLALIGIQTLYLAVARRWLIETIGE